MPFLDKLIAKYGARTLQLAALVFVVVLFILWLVIGAKCSADRQAREKAAQSAQTDRSVTATNQAASDAVNTVVKRSDAENAIDAATVVASKEIGDAQSSDDVRAAVTRSLCMRVDFRNDPACRVQ